MTLFNVLQIKFECRHSVSIDFIWNLKFDVGFFNAFLFRKVLNKNSLLKCSWRAYYAPFAVLRYIFILTSITPLFLVSRDKYIQGANVIALPRRVMREQKI